MSAEDLERYETDIELQLYREYKDVAPIFKYVVETERRFYLANEVSTIIPTRGARILRWYSPTRGCGICTAPHDLCKK